MPALVCLKSCNANSLVKADAVPLGYVFATRDRIGGTGLLGRRIVRHLLDANLAIRITSRCIEPEKGLDPADMHAIARRSS